jgi:hypothetical protein
MKNIRKAVQLLISNSLIAAVCALCCCGCSNVVSLKSGNLAALKGAKVVNLEYAYDGMKVGNRPEEEYVKMMMEKADKKSPGTSTNWLYNWQNNRAMRYQPKFEQLLNKQMTVRDADLHFGNHPEAKYTLLLKTVSIRLGYQAVVAARPAFLDADAIIFETQNRENHVAEVTLRKMVGMDPMGVAAEQGWRVQESYAKSGKELGARIAKKVK